MGCGASKIAPQSDEQTKTLHTKESKTAEHGELRSNGHVNGNVSHPNSSGKKDSETSGIKPRNAVLNRDVHSNPPEKKDVSNQQPLGNISAENRHSSTNGVSQVSPLPAVSKAVAFDIQLGQNGSVPLPNRPPRRLKKIESAPVLTREALEQKLAAAEQNRQKELEKKVKVSKRRSELLLARKMDKAQQQKAEIEEKLAASEKKREKTQAEIKAKQKNREERARRVRMRAREMKDGDDVVDLNVDHDETYNADEEDESWDIDSPQSPSRSVDQDDDNNNQTFDGRPNAGPQTQSSEARKDEQDQNLSEVHDFFDS